MRRALGWLLALVVALAATLAIALSAPPGQRLLDRLAADAPQGGAVVPPPNSHGPSPEAASSEDPTSLSPSPSVSERVVVPLDVPPSPTALPQAPEATPDAAAISAALTRRLSAPALGPHVVAAVAPLTGGEMLFEVGDGSAAPASTMKLMTTTAVLKALGPEHRFTTRVVSSSVVSSSGVSSQSPGLIVLVGGGDPYLARHRVPSAYPQRADVVTLARATAEALRAEGKRRVRVGYDASLFPGPAANPRWRSDYVSAGIVSPTSALWVDEGRGASGYGRVTDPAAEAAASFAAALRAAGVRVVGQPRPRQAAEGAETLASVESAPLREIVAHVLEVSDNEAAEVLARHVGVAVADDGSIEAAQTAIAATLAALEVPLEGSQLLDGSGLARDNRLSTAALVEVLRLAADEAHPELRAVLTGLPVGGFTGSLQWRFDASPLAGRGTVRAKTGTLTGVHGLAGVATDRNGVDFAFVLIADRVSENRSLAARAALDLAAAALGACRCSAK